LDLSIEAQFEVNMRIERPVVIVGGGIAGLTVAKTLIENGVPCAIVERGAGLGGNVANWACMATDTCQRCFCCSVEGLIAEVRSSQKAQILTGWELASVSDSNAGLKRAVLRQIETGAEEELETPALTLATGFEPYNPSPKLLWGYGRLEGVYTTAELDSLIREDDLSKFTGGKKSLKAAFFQCVGSREASGGADYCSQHCCKAALRMALKLSHELPEIAVTIFYIDLQTAGKYGARLLQTAQDKGISLRQGVPGEITLNSDNMLEVIVEQDGRNVRESFDRIILSIGQRPHASTSTLANELSLGTNRFGFIESSGALDCGRTGKSGIYLAGTCSGPMDIERATEHAGLTAAAIMADLQRSGSL
jgi:heterodisulfide reductase subunit A